MYLMNLFFKFKEVVLTFFLIYIFIQYNDIIWEKVCISEFIFQENNLKVIKKNNYTISCFNTDCEIFYNKEVDKFYPKSDIEKLICDLINKNKICYTNNYLIVPYYSLFFSISFIILYSLT